MKPGSSEISSLDKGEQHDEEARVKNKIAEFFDKYGSRDAVSEILKIIEPFLNSGMVRDAESVTTQMEACRHIGDELQDEANAREVFIERVFEAQKPVLKFREENPSEFQRLGRESVENFPINEVLSYSRAPTETGETQAYIHLDPVKHGEVSIDQVVDGFKKLKEIVQKNEGIKVINADSWVTAKKTGGRILEAFGFTLGKVLTHEEREKYFGGEKRPVRKSSITREDFLSIDLENLERFEKFRRKIR